MPKKQAELPSSSEIAGADEIELEEIAKSTEDLIFQINDQSQTDDLFEHPLCKLLGLDKQLRSIRGSLKVEVYVQQDPAFEKVDFKKVRYVDT